MKKQMRIFIFAALLILLLGVTVLAVSAAGEYRVYADQATAVADTENEAGTAYDTLKAAVAAITANGQYIKLTADVTDAEKATFSKAFTYTVDGGGHTITSTLASGANWVFSATAGTVTVNNLTLARDNQGGNMIAATNKGANIVLTDVTVTGGQRVFDIQKFDTLTINGGSYGTGNSQDVLYLWNNSGNAYSTTGLITINGGTFTGRSYCVGAKVVINDGTFSNDDDAIFYVGLDGSGGGSGNMSPIIINGGTFTVTGDCAVIKEWYPYYESKNFIGAVAAKLKTDSELVLLKITDGTFHINGVDACAVLTQYDVASVHTNNSGETPKIYITGGTFDTNQTYLSNGMIRDMIGSDSNAAAHMTLEYNIYGGAFTGCSYWLNLNGYSTYNIGNPDTHAGPTCFGGTYSGNVEPIYGGIYAGTDVSIYGGTFDLTPSGGNALLGGIGPITVTGGTFNGQLTSETPAMLITGGRFKADSGYEAYVPGRGYVGVTDDSTYKRVTAANLHGFAGSQMRLGTDLGVYFYVLTIDAVDSGTPSLTVAFDESTLATLTEYTTPATYPDGSAVESGYTLYCFTFNGLPPQRMGDDLDVVFKLTDVAKFGNEFSVLRYCRQVRAANSENGELLAVTASLLNFGAAAQTYSGYKFETLVNATAADVTGATAFSAVSEKHAVYGGTLGSAHFVKTEEYGVAARGVRFDTGIQLYARVIDTTGETTCTYSVAGGEAVACTKVDLGGNRYAFYTGAITLDHFEDNVVFTLSTGETCTYSVQAFVYYYQDMDAKAGKKALARALWAYKTAVVGAAATTWTGFDVADVVNP